MLSRAIMAALAGACALALSSAPRADSVNVDQAVQHIMHTAIENFARNAAGQPPGSIPNWKVDSMTLNFQPQRSLALSGGDATPKVAAGYFGYLCNDKAGEDKVTFTLIQGASNSYSSEWETAIELSTEFSLEGSAEIEGLGAKESASFGFSVTESWLKGQEQSTSTDLKVINEVTAEGNTEVAALVQVVTLELENVDYTLTITAAGHFEVTGLCYVFGRGNQTCTHISDQIENLVDEADRKIVLTGKFQNAAGNNSQAMYYANSAQYAWAMTEDITAAGGCKGAPNPPPNDPPPGVVKCPSGGTCTPAST